MSSLQILFHLKFHLNSSVPSPLLHTHLSHIIAVNSREFVLITLPNKREALSFVAIFDGMASRMFG